MQTAVAALPPVVKRALADAGIGPDSPSAQEFAERAVLAAVTGGATLVALHPGIMGAVVLAQLAAAGVLRAPDGFLHGALAFGNEWRRAVRELGHRRLPAHTIAARAQRTGHRGALLLEAAGTVWPPAAAR